MHHSAFNCTFAFNSFALFSFMILWDSFISHHFNINRKKMFFHKFHETIKSSDCLPLMRCPCPYTCWQDSSLFLLSSRLQLRKSHQRVISLDFSALNPPPNVGKLKNLQFYRFFFQIFEMIPYFLFDLRRMYVEWGFSKCYFAISIEC